MPSEAYIRKLLESLDDRFKARKDVRKVSMTDNKSEKPEVSVRGCFFHVLYRWRSILAAAVICAVLFGGFAYMKNREIQAYLATNPVDARTVAQSHLDPSSILYSELTNSSVAYQESSILMKVDPKREWQARAYYTVQTDLPADRAIMISAAYPASVFFGWDVEKAAMIYGDEGKNYASELFSCTPLSNSPVFMLQAIGLTEEMAEQGLSLLQQSVQRFSDSDAQLLGQHTIAKLSSCTIQIADSETEKKQIMVARGIPKYQEGIESNSSTINTKGTLASKKSLPKFVIIGFVLGAVALILVYIILYMLSNKLQSCDLIQEQLGLPIYGIFPHTRARRSGKGIDGLIEKLEFRGRMRDRDTVIAGICALVEDRSESDICIVSTLPSVEIQPVCDAINLRLKGKRELKVEADLLKNHQAIETASQAEAILMMEELYTSDMNDIQRMAEVLRIGNTPVIGAIVI